MLLSYIIDISTNDIISPFRETNRHRGIKALKVKVLVLFSRVLRHERFLIEDF